MKTQCLFIGGPAAGKMIEVDLKISNISIPKLMDGGFGEVVYGRRYLRDSDGISHSVFCLRDADPLTELMNAYAGIKS